MLVERRSRTTYRPTVTPEGSTHVDTFTGTTSSFSRTASGRIAAVAVVRQQVFAEAPRPAAKAVAPKIHHTANEARLPCNDAPNIAQSRLAAETPSDCGATLAA